MISRTTYMYIYILSELVTMEPIGNSKKSKPQMGFEPMTLCDLVGCSNH